MHIVNLSPSAIICLAEAASRADAEGRRFRVSFDTARTTSGTVNTFSYKVGEGVWSAPFYDEPDPYREQSSKF